jgi:hypothetical protein
MLLMPRELLAAVRRQKDFDGLMLELSGFTAGRIPRFLRPKEIERIRCAAGLSTGTSLSDRARRTVELMETVSQRLAVIDRALERAMRRSRQRLQETQGLLEEIRARASVSEDGRRAYRTEDRRRAFYDDGEELTREQIAKVHWLACAPTWEQRQAAGEAVRQAKQAHENLETYKARVDYYRDRMASGDALSEDDLKDMKADLEAMPKELQAEFTSQEHERAAEATDPEPAIAPAGAGRGLAGGAFTLSASDLDDIAQTERAPQPPRPDFPSP